MGSKKSDNGSAIVVGIVLVAVFCALAWPYYLGTWLAVEFGADNPSTARTATGWVLESIYLIGLVGLGIWSWWSDEREKEKARRLEAEKRQREIDFGSDGARLYESAEAAIARIAGSEAARAGWLGDPADFDFRADLWSIAANLRRAEEIRKVMAGAAGIRRFTRTDEQMLDDARRTVAALEQSVQRRVELIGECARQAEDIDRALREERENAEDARRREELRGRLGTVLYGSPATPAEEGSESADVVKARAAAFHELKALVDKHRIDEGQ
ncbi:hypothetical protein [Gordonia paraffinivorans]|uniref:hypothetical protein n=1 Tax=Gordonia paraffinivorans TaxID=175628 RepID=UPI0024303AC3|nr:hypothetical protein [Gordonia paraffinivorans]